MTVIQVYVPTTNAEEAEVEWFCEDLQDLLKLAPKKDMRGRAGDCSRVTSGQMRPHLCLCLGPNVPLQGRQGSRLLTMPKPLTVWITISCGKF